MLLIAQMSIELSNKLISIRSMNCASICDRFAARSRATEAMHADLKEISSGGGIKIQNIANDGFFGYYHEYFLRICLIFFYYNGFGQKSQEKALKFSEKRL
jgi:hypothetical protein